MDPITSLGLNLFIYKMFFPAWTFCLSVTQFEWLSSYKHLLLSIHFLPSLSRIIFPNRNNLIESQDIWFLSDLKAERRHGLGSPSLVSSWTQDKKPDSVTPSSGFFPIPSASLIRREQHAAPSSFREGGIEDRGQWHPFHSASLTTYPIPPLWKASPRVSGCQNPWPHQEIKPYELMRRQFMIMYNQGLTEFGAVIDNLSRLSKTLRIAVSPKVGKTSARAQQYHRELFILPFWNPWGVGLLPQICDFMLNRATPALGITSLSYHLQNLFWVGIT